MKKLAGLLVIVLVLYSVYNDFNHGSLPVSGDENNNEAKTITQKDHQEEKAENKTEMPYFEKEIEPGDTVLSVLENELNDPIPVPISDVVTDFVQLNNGTKPEDIKYGNSYKFPDYHKGE